MMQMLWKTIWQFLRKLKIEWSYDIAIPLLTTYSKDLKTWNLTEIKDLYFESYMILMS